RPPFSPDDVCAEFSDLLKSYGISKVTGDRYAGEWPRERFRAHGIAYDPCGLSKSDLYRDALPVLNSATVDLLDDAPTDPNHCPSEANIAFRERFDRPSAWCA